MANQSQGNKRFRQESDYDKKIVIRALSDIATEFNNIGGKHGLNANEQAAYVWTIFTSNLSLLEKACNEPEQLKRALLTCAGVGLSLDPGRQYAYLTVRRGKLIFDVGYRGLIKLAVDEGLVIHVKPELVYAKDQFAYNGPHERPTHTNTDHFGDRGSVVGAYCEAALPDGSLVIETMRESEFKEISALNPDSDAWAKEFSSGEMRKKTVIKRASKWWYNSAVAGSDASSRLESAITYLNTEAGEGLPDKDPDNAAQTNDGSSSTAHAEEVRVFTPDDVDSAALEVINKVIERAKAAGAFAAAKQFANDRYTGNNRGYLVQEIVKLEKAAQEGSAPENG